MITITISGEQGEGKTSLMWLIFRRLRALDYNVVTETSITGPIEGYHDIYICTRQVKAGV